MRSAYKIQFKSRYLDSLSSAKLDTSDGWCHLGTIKCPELSGIVKVGIIIAAIDIR